MTGRRFIRVAALGLTLGSGLTTGLEAASATEQESFRQVVRYHLDRYPAWGVQDLYKLVFQAAMGSEHGVPNRQTAQQWLEREMSTLIGVAGEPFSDPLSPDGDLVRVNLRAYIERGGDMGRLLDAFVSTAEQFRSSEERLERYWGYVEAMAREQTIPFDVVEMQRLWREMKSQGLPAVRHSTPYRDQYQPAYRVVLLELLKSDGSAVSGQ